MTQGPKKSLLTTLNPDEILKFEAMANEWWDPNGKFKPLHKLNPVRLDYIEKIITQQIQKPISQLKILDIGSGGGLVSEYFAKLGANITGIDGGEANIKIATLHAEKQKLPIDYACATSEDFCKNKKNKEAFDCVFALEIIEHVENPNLFIQSALSCLKPGGLFFASTLNRTLKSYAAAIIGAEYLLRWLPIGTHDWRKFFRPSELIKLIEENAAKVQSIDGIIYNPLTDKFSIHPTKLDINYILWAKKR